MPIDPAFPPTPAPWCVAYGAIYQGTPAELAGPDPRRLLLAERDYPAIPPWQRDANIHRAVECVNACDGIADPVAALAELRAAVAQAVECRSLNSVRGRLLSALAALGGPS